MTPNGFAARMTAFASSRNRCSIDRMADVSVLSVTSEIYPLVKTGGLADVAGALPAALMRENIAMRTLVPGYPTVQDALEDREVLHTFPSMHGAPARLVAGRAAGLDLLVLDAPH